MISFFLAAPGLMGEDVRAYVHRELLRKNLLWPAGHNGAFTWDGTENAITMNPRWPKSYSWIDFVLWVRGSSAIPAYMDNRAIRLTSPVPFPELASYLTKNCQAKYVRPPTLKEGEVDPAAPSTLRTRRAALVATQLCLKPGMPCTAHPGADEPMTKYGEYVARLREALHLGSVDDDDVWGEALLEVLQSEDPELVDEVTWQHKRHRILEMMDPLLAPLFSESSDHYAVLSNVSFEATKAQDHSPSMRADSSGPFSNVLFGKRAKDVNIVRPEPRGGMPPVSLRILTQNLHFRPYDLRVPYRGVSKCSKEDMALNMQELRAVVFVEALKNMLDSEFPDILCLQETQHKEANIVLQRKLRDTRLSNSVTSLTVSRQSARPDKPRGAVIWSGLQIWTSWTIVDSTFLLFSDTLGDATAKALAAGVYAASGYAMTAVTATAGYLTSKLGFSRAPPTPRAPLELRRRLGRTSAKSASAETKVRGEPAASAGVDKFLVNKGLLYALLQHPVTGKKVQIIVTHPSPYVFYAGLEGTLLASKIPEEVAEAHRQQLNVLRQFIEELLEDERLKGIPIFVAGDLNINRYAVTPDTEEEQNPVTAMRGRSGEFDQVLRKLHVAVPAFVADVNTDRWVPKDQLQSARMVEKVLNRRFPVHSHDTRR